MHLSPPLGLNPQIDLKVIEALEASDIFAMSALESPPTLLTPAWPDPWSATGGHHQLGNIHHQGSMGMGPGGMHLDMNAGLVLPMNGMLGPVVSTHDFYGPSSTMSDNINTSPVGNQIKNLNLQSLQPVTSSSNQDLSSANSFLSLHPGSNVNNVSINSSSSDNSCNSGTNNTGSVGSVHSAGSKKRTVNFKLDIKPEPLVNPSAHLGGSAEHDGVQYLSQGILQKVPSISDLSEPESSLDLPITQVRTHCLYEKLYNLKIKFSNINYKYHLIVLV